MSVMAARSRHQRRSNYVRYRGYPYSTIAAQMTASGPKRRSVGHLTAFLCGYGGRFSGVGLDQYDDFAEPRGRQ
jgi:hypothetical protein